MSGAEAKAPEPAPESTLLPAQHWAQIPETADDADSTYDEDDYSTASITSTILKYRTIHGRTYHSDQGNAEYWATNDKQQNDAMDINHHVLTLANDGKLHLAPLPEKVEKVVDIGTATGIWAIDFADAHPDVTVIGTDISPIQPTWVPPNLEFQIDDCTQEWTFAENSLDFVHIRWLVGSIIDWPALYKQAYRCLKPGGYLESNEPSPHMISDDGSVHDKTATHQWGQFFIEGGRKMGRPFTVVDDNIQTRGMQDAGFVDIVETDLKNPIGKWPKDEKLKEVGKYAQVALEQDMVGTVLYMATLLGWSKEEIEVYVAHFRRELRSGKVHTYYKSKVVYGRKPLS